MATKDADYSVAKRNMDYAITAECSKNYVNARNLYLAAMRHLDKVLQKSQDARIKEQAKKFKSDARDRIKFIDALPPSELLKSKANRESQTLKVSITSSVKEAIVKKLKNLDEKAVHRVLGEVYEDCSAITFNDIAGNDRAKQILKEAVILPTLRPELFTGLRSPVRGVLLFGPPGNGKTMLAKAVASESNATFFNISAASLLSKWVGESENTVRALFAVARELEPSIIFLDEVDSLMTARRSDSGHDVSRRVLTQLLMEMDGVCSGDERLLILGATNRPDELDSAALRRFPKRVYVRMPDATARADILVNLLQKNPDHNLSSSDIQRIAKSTEGYSASDLHELAKEAALGPVREIAASELPTVSVQKVRPIGIKDFVNALRTVGPSLSPSASAPYENWNEKFGDMTTAPKPPRSLFNKGGSSTFGLL